MCHLRAEQRFQIMSVASTTAPDLLHYRSVVARKIKFSERLVDAGKTRPNTASILQVACIILIILKYIPS